MTLYAKRALSGSDLYSPKRAATESLRRSINIRVAKHDFPLAAYVDEDTRLTQVNKTFMQHETSQLANSEDIFITFALGYHRERGSSVKSLSAREGPSVFRLRGMKAGQMGLKLHITSLDTIAGHHFQLETARIALCRRGLELCTGLSQRASDAEREKAAVQGIDEPEFRFDEFFLFPVTIFVGEDGSLDPKAVTVQLEGSPQDGRGVINLQAELTCNILEDVSIQGRETTTSFTLTEEGEGDMRWTIQAKVQLLRDQSELDRAAADPRCIHWAGGGTPYL